jgi:hypothetical protein
MPALVLQKGGVVALTDIIRVSYVFWQNGQQGIIDVAYRWQSMIGTVTLGDCAAGAFDTIIPLMIPMQTPLVNTLGTKASRLSGVSPFPLPGIANSAGTIGTAGGGNTLPGQVAANVTLKTAFAGTRYRGRVYLPFVSDRYNDPANNIPTAAYALLAIPMAVGLAGAVIITGLSGSGILRPVIWHRATQTYDAVTDFTVQMRWSTQKRRGDYGKVNPSVLQ